MSALIFIGMLLSVIGGLWLLIVAFQESILWGLGCLFIPFLSLIFAILHWEVSKRPFLLSLAGGILWGIGAASLHQQAT